jgi:hypothetical protein
MPHSRKVLWSTSKSAKLPKKLEQAKSPTALAYIEIVPSGDANLRLLGSFDVALATLGIQCFYQRHDLILDFSPPFDEADWLRRVETWSDSRSESTAFP